MTTTQIQHRAQSATASPAISLTGLTKSLGSVHAVRGIDLTIQRGEVAAFLGTGSLFAHTRPVDEVLAARRPDRVGRPDGGQVLRRGATASPLRDVADQRPRADPARRTHHRHGRRQPPCVLGEHPRRRPRRAHRRLRHLLPRGGRSVCRPRRPGAQGADRRRRHRRRDPCPRRRPVGARHLARRERGRPARHTRRRIRRHPRRHGDHPRRGLRRRRPTPADRYPRPGPGDHRPRPRRRLCRPDRRRHRTGALR